MAFKVNRLHALTTLKENLKVIRQQQALHEQAIQALEKSTDVDAPFSVLQGLKVMR